jgi:two-component system sensor histidine kinase BaeS
MPLFSRFALEQNSIAIKAANMTARSIRIKLFLTFLLTTLLLVSGMYAFMRWSLDRGFNEFIKSRQQERV